MKPVPSVLALALVFSAALTISLRAATRPSGPWQSPSGDSFPNKSVVIYVADFDIDVVPGKDARNSPAANVPRGTADGSPGTEPNAPPPNAAGNATPAPQEAARTDASNATASGTRTDSQRPDPPRTEVKDDSPAAQAARLVNLIATDLVKALEQAGYTARRLRNGSRPDAGIVIRGVFAQADAQAGLRRMVVGGDSTDSKMVLFVGVGNLSRPDQAVYLPVGPTSADGRLGPVINVSVYAPISRFELDKNPPEDSLKTTAAQIVSEVTTLLNANRLAVGE
jgi:hypothetical protein